MRPNVIEAVRTAVGVTAAVTILTLAAAPPASATLSSNDDPSAIGAAISGQPGLLAGASWPADGLASNPSSSAAVGTGNGFTGIYMPNTGPSFGVLTTGDVENAAPPNDSSSTGTDNGQGTRNVNDLSVLKLDITVPASANCLSFDLVFYSEEYPEYVGSPYNDGFVAELDTNSWTYDPEFTSIAAPDNFAFDENHNLLTINSASFTAEGETELEYDGSTQLLTAATPITPGAHSVYLSLFDAGDGIYDTAVFLDNLRTESVAPADCTAGARTRDTDGDALPDTWEEHGYDHDGDLTADVDLPGMGADPNHKDVFIELDAMNGLRLSAGAMQSVIDAFAAAPVSNPDGSSGIDLHVDNGSGSVMDPHTGALWGSSSQATAMDFVKSIGFFEGDEYNWSAFDARKASFFAPEREPIFHYALSINRYGDSGSSGISRGIGASDFIVSLGMRCNPEGSCPGPVRGQAGTFMHELGHNLGLKHGGTDHVNNKPNFLSIMNYSFQFTGLLGGGVDYSRFSASDIPDLDESHLFEAVGFNTSVGSLGTLINCDGGFFGDDYWSLVSVSGAVDFNCDADINDSDIDRDLNRDGAQSHLQSFDDWQAIELKGGSIGGEGLSVLLPEATESNEPSVSEIQEISEAGVPTPTLTGGAVAGIALDRATVHISVNPRGRPVEVAVQYGRTAAYGSQTAFAPVGSGSQVVEVAVPIAGLDGGSYHYQAIARSPEHLIYSPDGVFDTGNPSAPPPEGRSFSPPVSAVDRSVVLLSGIRLARRLLRRNDSLTIRFIASRPAPVLLTVQKRAAKGTPKRWVRVSQIRRAARAGANTIRLRSKQLRLKPARYRILVAAIAEDGTRVGGTALSFRVTP